MKKIALILVAALVLFSSCEKEKIQYLQATVTIDLQEVPDGAPSPDFYTVKVTNFETGYERVAKTVSGAALVDSLIAGVYTISVQETISKDGFTYMFSGTLNNVDINVDNGQYTLPVKMVEESALVIKEVFYTGSEGYYFRDQFYEIYNNSDQVVYADGLSIGVAMSESIYTWNIENEDDYLFFQYVWNIPGDGDDYPIQPGESIVLAQYAADHNADKMHAAKKSLDNSTADFEFYIDKFSNKQVDCNAINMMVSCNSSFYMYQYLNPVSGFPLAIFYPSAKIVDENFIFSLTPSTSSKAREVLRSDIVDAVEFISDETKLEKKALPTDLDAGAIWCSGVYVHESVMRKVKEEKDGRKIYQDTNNTTNDFEVSKAPEMRRNGAKRPSWSNWTTSGK